MQIADLPAVTATLNGMAAIFPLTGDVLIRRGRRELHKRCMLAAMLATFAAQPAPDRFINLDALQSIPAPAPMTIRPRMFAAYGALIAAAMLIILYLHRGRAFVVYWIVPAAPHLRLQRSAAEGRRAEAGIRARV